MVYSHLPICCPRSYYLLVQWSSVGLPLWYHTLLFLFFDSFYSGCIATTNQRLFLIQLGILPFSELPSFVETTSHFFFHQYELWQILIKGDLGNEDDLEGQKRVGLYTIINQEKGTKQWCLLDLGTKMQDNNCNNQKVPTHREQLLLLSTAKQMVKTRSLKL